MVAKNEGKMFEEDFIKSVPENLFHYRLRDLPFHLTRNAKYEVNNNIGDFFIMNDNLFILELKSTALSSYPFSNSRENQIKGLAKASTKDGVICGFVINMRKFEETYFLYIDDYIDLLENSGRKSISIDDLRLRGIRIYQIKKRVRFKYDLEDFFRKILK